MSYKIQDHYFKKAKELGFKARSVFKLEEMDQRYHVLKTGMNVIDLGAAPGSWSQYTSKKIGPNGKLLGLDLSLIDLKLSNAQFVQADILKCDLQALFTTFGMPLKIDCVLSDMAPNTTGIRMTDQARSFELCEMALNVAKAHLRPGGNFVCKFFQSNELQKFQMDLKKSFRKVEICKPKGTRTRSFEIFLIGFDFRSS
jgi:23S rRNA (uridine2552-2'-O)-methyltransferase